MYATPQRSGGNGLIGKKSYRPDLAVITRANDYKEDRGARGGERDENWSPRNETEKFQELSGKIGKDGEGNAKVCRSGEETELIVHLGNQEFRGNRRGTAKAMLQGEGIRGTRL